MKITKGEAIELIRFFDHQFIDQNSNDLYDGMVIKRWLKRLNEFVNESKQCNARHTNGWAICTLPLSHDGTHKDVIGNCEWSNND